jgi:hypothetical protein
VERRPGLDARGPRLGHGLRPAYAAPATAQQLVDHIRALPGVASVLRYMIYNRKIYRASNGWKPRRTPARRRTPSTSTSPAPGRRPPTTTPASTTDLEEIPVALTADDKKWLTTLVNGVVDKVRQTYPARTARVALNDLSSASGTPRWTRGSA